MVTVLLVGATLTAVSSAAAFVAVREFRAGGDDRRSAEVLAIAEAGVDRFLIDVRGGTYDWGDINEAGCELAPLAYSGTVGGGRYSAKLTVYNPTKPPQNRIPASPWTVANDTDVSGPCTGRSEHPRPAQLFAITSEGTLTAGGSTLAKRVVRQVVSIGASGLPVGLFADNVTGGGSPSATNISLVSPGDFTGRQALDFEGTDPFYLKSDFYAGFPNDPMPAASHVTGTSYVRSLPEHPPALRCGGGADDVNEYIWDGSGTGGNRGTLTCAGYAGTYPPKSLFTADDLRSLVPEPRISDQVLTSLKSTAQRKGLYCGPSTSTCTKNGASYGLSGGAGTTRVSTADVGGLPDNFVAFFDFPTGDPTAPERTINWDAVVNYPFVCEPFKSVTLVIRNGSLKLTSGAAITGLVIVPEGSVDLGGTYTVHGTVIAKNLSVRGTGDTELSECWAEHMPGAALNAVRVRFSELDR